ncbi:MAG TPA: hypothetical protein VJ499_16815 [Flavisolibacter sp.]|nr:hypothetical protein [Flavisolibacter sp.]
MTDSLSWESWEEWDELNHCNILYVVGEINTRYAIHHLKLIKKELPGLPASNLLLDLVPEPVHTTVKNQELIYMELVGQKNYTSITIFFNHRVLTEITEIEKADSETKSWNDEQWDEII